MSQQPCTCPTNDQGLRVDIDPACRRHPGHKGIGFPDCWCPQDGLIGQLATAMDCPQHGRPATRPMSRYATGGLISGPLPVDGDGVPMWLSPGYQLSRSDVEQLGGDSAVMRAFNDAQVADIGVSLSGQGQFDRSTADPSPELSETQTAAVEAIQHEAARRFATESAQRETLARSWLSARIVEALNGQDGALSIDHNGDVFDAVHGEYGSVVMSAGQLSDLVDLFASLLANPPVMATDADGVTRVERR